MTPEQEILQDALTAARQRIDRFASKLKSHARTLPLDASRDWSSPSAEIETEMAAFVKRYEMTQDVITRQLFRSVLVAHGLTFRSRQTADIVRAAAELGIVADLERWEEITKLRNSFAHDYVLAFANLVPLLNQAWRHAPDLTSALQRAERHVADNHLLEPKADQ